MSFRNLKVGDKVKRNMANIVMPGEVMFVEGDVLYWTADNFRLKNKEDMWAFDEKGWEYDEEMGWGHKFGLCISHLV